MLRILTTLIILAAATPGAARAELVADLSAHLVAITTGFTGTKVLLFGTTGGTGDVVVVVRGPENDEAVRRKGRRLGIWVNEAEMVFDGVPSFYSVAASRPLSEFLPERVAEREQIGFRNLRVMPPEDAAPAEIESFRAALIRNKERVNLYDVESTPITFLGNRLFRTDIYFPANAPVGTYFVRVLLLQDGQVVSAEITPLIISKIGFEAGVYDFAHRHSLAYGVLAILIAVVAGWTASVAFHKG